MKYNLIVGLMEILQTKVAKFNRERMYAGIFLTGYLDGEDYLVR